MGVFLFKSACKGKRTIRDYEVLDKYFEEGQML